MDSQKGILFLYDPEKGKEQLPKLLSADRTDVRSVRYLDAAQCISDAQDMLYLLRTGYSRNCIAAEGRACCIALALAAQLMPDRIVLCGPDIFSFQTGDRSKKLRQIENFAIRNMSLITAEIVLLDADMTQVRALIRMLGRHARGSVRITNASEYWNMSGFLPANP